MGLLNLDERALIRLCLEQNIGSVVTGSFHADLFESARVYADSMARKGRQDGHAGWSQRSAALQRLMPSHPGLYEITAESWDHFHEPEGREQQRLYQQYQGEADDDAPEFYSGVRPIGFYDAEAADVPAAIAKSLIDSWRSSSGHWRILNDTVKFYGVGVAKGSRAYYGVVIVAK